VPLGTWEVADGARVVPFGAWAVPVGSQILAIRSRAAVIAVHPHTIALEDVSKRAQALTTAPEAGTNQVQALAIQLAGDAAASYAGAFGMK
jgi:hypothetical protein